MATSNSADEDFTYEILDYFTNYDIIITLQQFWSIWCHCNDELRVKLIFTVDSVSVLFFILLFDHLHKLNCNCELL